MKKAGDVCGNTGMIDDLVHILHAPRWFFRSSHHHHRIVSIAAGVYQSCVCTYHYLCGRSHCTVQRTFQGCCTRMGGGSAFGGRKVDLRRVPHKRRRFRRFVNSTVVALTHCSGPHSPFNFRSGEKSTHSLSV